MPDKLSAGSIDFDGVIMAGGRGSRMIRDGFSIPKVIIPVTETSVLEEHIALLRKFKANNIFICLHENSSLIKNFVQSKFHDHKDIIFLFEKQPRGSVGCLLDNFDLIQKRSIILFGDTYADVNLDKALEFHLNMNADLTTFAYPNDHPKDSDLLIVENTSRVVGVSKYPHRNLERLENLANRALFIAEKSALVDNFKPSGTVDLSKELIPFLIAKGLNVQAYRSPEYMKDMGTKPRLEKLRSDLSSRKHVTQRIDAVRKAVFLDRDGVINHDTGHIRCARDLKLFDFSSRAISLLNSLGYLVLLVSNQPVIARGEVTEAEFKLINAKLDFELSNEHAFIDKKYYCPHHPDAGFDGEITELKRKCDCRKPETGLIAMARQDYNIDIKNSWMVGDQTSDIELGRRVGLLTIAVETGFGLKDLKNRVRPDFKVPNLLEAVSIITGAG
jgi:D,D-heptose 1,7-bisphosphate phosphatase